MAEDKQVLRETTPEVIAEARQLLDGATHGALGTIAPADGWPQVTRVGLAMFEGRPLLLISGLAAHTAALRADARCTLMVGEAGKGDPLAHPRLMIRARAVEILRSDVRHAAARAAYLAAQPKAQLYVDLPDFAFMQLVPESISYNAGFGRAYAIEGTAFGD